MITTIQIIVLVFVVFAASRVILRAKDKKISVTELFFWLAVWAGLTGVVFFPELTAPAAAFLDVGRGIDVIIYMSIGLLFYLIFRLYVKIEELQQDVTAVVRKEAIDRKKKK